MADYGDDAVSASTETLSDLEARTQSDMMGPRGRSYTESFEVGGGSGSESQQDMEMDSEATVTDMEGWESGSDQGDAGSSWQPTQRLTARQLARQERLLQGINQTQWTDMHLPKGLDLRNKARQKETVSEEQHLKRVKAAAVRRVQTQKARRDTLEVTKARIRAATSSKFRDMVGNNQKEKTKACRSEHRLAEGMIRIRHHPEKSVLVLPQASPVPQALQARKLDKYPSKKVCLDFDLEDGFCKDVLKLGMSVNLTQFDEKLVVTHEGHHLGCVSSALPLQFDTVNAKLKSIRYEASPSRQPRTITLLLESQTCEI